jgi:hypothetical protein
MLMVGLISGSVLVSMGPNVSAIVERDINQKVFNNNELLALQFGDLSARARTVVPDPCVNAVPSAGSVMPQDIGPLYSRNGEVMTNVSAAIHVCTGAAGVVIRPAINQTQQNYTDFY